MAVARAESRRVARLFNRAGFGADTATIDAWAAKGYAAVVESLLNVAHSASRLDDLDPAVQLLRGTTIGSTLHGDEGILAYQTWWLKRMATTSYPLEEKLTLYWHGHFATSYTKVQHAGLMMRQNRVLRDHALGDFRGLCNQMTSDPAMLIWLDGKENHAGKINENYGREFMELFTLGKGHYTQADVVAAARAFTGFTTDEAFSSKFDPALHDKGAKTLLGNTGAWGPTDVTNIVLDRHPEGTVAAHYVAKRLASFLYRPDPEPAVVDAMAASFAAGGRYDIRQMVRTLLLRPEFIDGPAQTIKSPVELTVGSLKALLLTHDNNPFGTTLGDDFANQAADMGQRLFQPPDVSGWKGGLAWANTATVLARYNFAAALAKKVDADVVAKTLDNATGVPRKTVQPWMARLGLLELSAATQAGIEQYLHGNKSNEDVLARGILTLLIASSDYNLR